MLSRVRKGGVEGGIPAGVAITERLGSPKGPQATAQCLPLLNWASVKAGWTSTP